jgi:invasion protein IalB
MRSRKLLTLFAIAATVALGFAASAGAAATRQASAHPLAVHKSVHPAGWVYTCIYIAMTPVCGWVYEPDKIRLSPSAV